MPDRAVPEPSAGGGWLTAHEASQLLGVSVATLRRWSQAGQVEAFVTPGGHRRFARSTILALLPGRSRRRSLSELGRTPGHTVRRYRAEIASSQPHGGSLAHLSDERREASRELGRRILAAVVAFLDAPSPDAAEASMRDAEQVAMEYGRLAATLDLGAVETTRIFQRLRAPFLDELGSIAKRRRLEVDEATTLVHAATLAFDRLLVALLEGYGADPSRPSPKARPGAERVAAASGTRSR